MITNKKITYFHRIASPESWQRVQFSDVWLFGGKGANINKGYENSNAVEVRIPMELVTNIDIFNIGDIIVVGDVGEITTQSDLRGKEFYNVTNMTINNFGYNPHIHLGGK